MFVFRTPSNWAFAALVSAFSLIDAQAARGADTTSTAKPTTQTSAPASKGLSCDELKASIASKLDAKGVKNYTLEIADPDAVGQGKIVGSCAAGSKRIVYTRK